jgi:hypothetical protein
MSLIDLSSKEVSYNLDTGLYEGRFSLLLKTKEALSLKDKIESKFFTYYNSMEHTLDVISDQLKINRVELFSLTGVKLVSFGNLKNKDKFELSVGAISDGVYIARCQNFAENVSEKIVISKK